MTTEGRALADEADWLARAIAVGSLGVAAYALWLNYTRDRREQAALKPQLGLVWDRVSPRVWKVTLTVGNPLKVPLVWRQVRAQRPKAALLANASSVHATTESPNRANTPFHPYILLPGGPVTIEPGGSATWDGFVAVDDRYGVPDDAEPELAADIDGIHSSRWRWRRRLSRWMWARPHNR